MNELPNPYEAPSEPLETSRNLAQRTGRTIVLVYIVLLVTISAVISGLGVLARGPENIAGDVIRFALTAALGYWLYRGSSAAKWITVVLLSIASVILVLGMLQVSDPLTELIIGALLVFHASFVFVLLFSPSVEAFLASQARNR